MGIEDLPEIKGFLRTTLIDWEGKVASEIFLGGCNFRCGFCHSKDLVLNPEQIESIPYRDVDSFLLSKKGWIDGVVICGGEPTLCKEELINLISRIKKISLLVKLDTNGTNPEALKTLFDMNLLDYVAMDIKAPLNQKQYSNAAGVDVDIDDIIKSKDLIIASGVDYEFRTTAVPNLISITEIEDIVKSISPCKRYRIQQFQPKDTLDESFVKLKPLKFELLQEMADLAKKYISDVSIKNT